MPSMIPKAYRYVAGVVGVENFLKLCDMWGGKGLYFPTLGYITKHGERPVSMLTVPKRDKEAALLIGIPAYVEIIEAYGGKTVYIPMRKAILRPVRDQWIRQEYASGEGHVRDIAAKYEISCTALTRICAGLQGERTKRKVI